jgi:hypothetical protein
MVESENLDSRLRGNDEIAGIPARRDSFLPP